MISRRPDLFRTLILICVSVLAVSSAAAQRTALLMPEKSGDTEKFASALRPALSDRFPMVDDSLAAAAYRSVTPPHPFNMTTREARRVGAAIGCDHFLLVRASTLRRSSSARPVYYESFAVVFGVSTRSGSLLYWNLRKFDAESPDVSERLLINSVRSLATDIASAIGSSSKAEAAELPPAPLEELPAEGSPEALDLRPPIPYLRIKPKYTELAFLYEVTATVDAEVDIDAGGTVRAVRIIRWAGFGLDESVVTAIREMNWRPAERRGRFLPMRVLTRYNFKKADLQEP